MRIDIANLAWQLGGDERLVRAVAEGDVTAYVEGRDHDDDPVPIKHILGAGFRVIQRLGSGSVAGSAFAVRRSSRVKIARWNSRRASRASRRGGGVQDRYALVVVLVEKTSDVIYETHLVIVHNPLRGTGMQDDSIDTVRGLVGRAAARRSVVRRRRSITGRRRIVRWAVVGDFNTSHEAMRNKIGGTGSLGVEVMGFVHGPGWGHPKLSTRHHAGSDHPILTVRT